MHQVVLNADGMITADGAGGGFGPVSRTDQIARHHHSLAAFQHQGHSGASGEKLQQALEERAGGMHRIMLLGQGLIGLHQLQTHQL